MLVLTLTATQSRDRIDPDAQLYIGDEIVISLLRTRGERACLAIRAPKEVPILRGKLYLENQGE